ncbi:MAG TPA: Rrf2 family transcriptional regulator [Acidimicrobiia bacterium]|nr:Rrf2 family transcriptional regulator [Acidimicrobiia bacterium]
MLNQTSRYALSVLCYLARAEERVPAHQIAADTGAPANYVAKILAALRRDGVVEGEKGWGGGYALRPQAGEVTFGRVMELFEEDTGPVACPFVQPQCGCHLAQHSEARVPVRPHTAGSLACPYGAERCTVTAPCPLHRHWARVREGYWGLAETRIGELAGIGAG